MYLMLHTARVELMIYIHVFDLINQAVQVYIGVSESILTLAPNKQIFLNVHLDYFSDWISLCLCCGVLLDIRLELCCAIHSDYLLDIHQILRLELCHSLGLPIGYSPNSSPGIVLFPRIFYWIFALSIVCVVKV